VYGVDGLKVGGIVGNRKMFGALITGVDHLPTTYNRAEQSFTTGEPDWGGHLADALEGLVALHDASTIAALIVEPVAASTGVLPPPKGYLQRLRAICDKHGILLIFDEVITGYGRVGAPFAAQRLGVIPDIMTTAKGVTNGVVPMGAVFASRQIHDAFMQGPPEAVEFFHGYTYSGHPVACAAALATLDIYEREGLLTRVLEIEPAWAEAIHSVRGSPHVTDIRNFGLMGAIDLAPRPGAPGARGYAALLAGLSRGLLLRASGDTLAFSPPLIVTVDQIGEMFETVKAVLAGIE
jgi:beta-alanine--pyruvate transaminase